MHQPTSHIYTAYAPGFATFYFRDAPVKRYICENRWCAEESSVTSYRVSLQKGITEALQTSLYPVRLTNRRYRGSAKRWSRRLGWVHRGKPYCTPCRVKAQLKGNATGATSACPVSRYNRRTECTKRRQRTMRAVRSVGVTRSNCGPAGRSSASRWPRSRNGYGNTGISG